MKGTVFIPPFSGAHRWFVISNNIGGEVLTVNITDAKHEDSTCILQPGDHVCVEKLSAVVYRRAKSWLVQELERNLGACTVYEELAGEALLQRMRTGAVKSEDLAKKFLKFVV